MSVWCVAFCEECAGGVCGVKKMIDRKTLIDDFCQKAKEGKAAFFIGAGISKPYGLPKFKELVHEEMAGKIDYAGEIDDCPEMMQYILNETGDDKAFYDGIKHRFDIPYDESRSSYLSSVAKSNITTIWTTNFDVLIEDALDKQEKAHETKRCETDFKNEYANRGDVEVIKIHGDIESDRIVLTKRDYEDFNIEHKLAIKRLENDMLSKCFMFVGYSYNDPNIRLIVNNIRQLLDCDTKSICHYLLLRKEKDDNEQKLQKLWLKDLKRYGINVYLYNDYDEIAEILSQICSKSKGKTVFVTGSHMENSCTFAEELGKRLIDIPDLEVNYGQSEGIGKIFCNSFAQTVIDRKLPLENYLNIYVNPYAFCKDWDNKDSIMPYLKTLRCKMFRHTQVLIAFPGKKGTLAEISQAIKEGTLVIPVFMKNGSYKNEVIAANPGIIENLVKIDESFAQKVQDSLITIDDLVDFLERIFN